MEEINPPAKDPFSYLDIENLTANPRRFAILFDTFSEAHKQKDTKLLTALADKCHEIMDHIGVDDTDYSGYGEVRRQILEAVESLDTGVPVIPLYEGKHIVVMGLANQRLTKEKIAELDAKDKMQEHLMRGF